MTTVEEGVIAARAARSRQAFEERLPKAAKKLPAEIEITQRLLDGDAVVNISMDEGMLYQGDARTLAAEHCARFDQRPLRFFLNQPSAANLGSPMSNRMLFAMQKAIREEEIINLVDKPDYVGSFMVVLGVGLGHHLPQLIQTTKARHILIVESFKEFMLHSFAAIDWAELFDIADERGIEIDCLLSDQPDQMLQGIQGFILRVGTPLIDGAYVFLHYNSWPLVETRDRLQMMIDDIFIARGFFEDELVMMKNATSNLMAHDSRLIDTRPKLERAETVLIVASGPSLDQSAEDLKRLAQDAVVMSCGTGLKACLGHGVVPDYHVEIENGESTYLQIALTAEKYDLKSITLIASVTIDPRISPLFGSSVFFFRDSLSSTKILVPPHFELFAASPTCVNGAVRFSAAVGIKNMILFGTDCGAKPGGPRHSKNSLYAENETFKKYELATDFNITLPGNFGGEIKTNWPLMLCQRYLGDIIQLHHLNVLNTSDGALIRGATPRRSKTIRKIPTPTTRAGFDRIIEICTHSNRRGEIFERLSFDSVIDNTKAMFEATLEMVDQAITDQDDMVAFMHRSRKFIKEELKNYGGTLSIIDGTIHSSPKIAMFFVHRIANPETRRRVNDLFLQEFRDIVEEMRRQTLELFDELLTEVRQPQGQEAEIVTERHAELSL